MSCAKVSVVLPTYNRANTLARAIRGVLSQSFSDLELIVVDDASTDNTAEVVLGFKDARVRYLPSLERLGVSRARNLGIQNALGVYVAFQDSDDEWRVEKLEKQLAAFQQGGSDVVLVACGDIVLNHYPMSYLGVDRDEAVVDITAMSSLRMPPAPCWMASKDALLKAGGFNEQLNCFEDWELSLRMSAFGRILMVNEPFTLRHRTPNSLFSTEKNYIPNLKLILDQHHERLHKHPSVWSYYCNLIGQTECQYGSCREGRRWFIEAFSAQPLSLRTWVNLIFSWLGTGPFKTYVAWARRAKSRYAAPVRPALFTGTR